MNTWAQHSPTHFFSKFFVKDVVNLKSSFPNAPKELIFLNEDDSLTKVLDTFKLHKILSSPVLSKGSSKVLGMLDMLDLVTFLTAKIEIPFLTEAIANHALNSFLSKTAKDVVELSSRNWWNELQETASLPQLISVLSNQNAHRVAVLNEKKKVYNIISQMDVLSFLFQHQSTFPQMMEAPISQWISDKKVETVSGDQTLAEAFKTIWESEVTGVGVVDDDGKLIGNISASDLKNCGRTSNELIQELYQPINEYLGFVESEDASTRNPSFSKHPLVVSKLSDTTASIFSSIINKRVHRVYIVDDADCPVNVVAPCDLLALFKELQ